MSYRNYGPANGFVVDPNGFGDFTTIGAALTAATTGTTLFLKPATYTENPILKAGVNLTAWGTDNSITTGTVVILGKCTMTVAGSVTITGVQVETNSDYALAVTGSAASQVHLTNCYLNASNNTAISYSSSSSSSGITLSNSTINLGTTGIAYHSHSSAGALSYYYCNLLNTGTSTIASSNSAGIVAFYYTTSGAPMATSSTGVHTHYWSEFFNNSINATALTLAGSGSSSSIFSEYSSGSASAISIGTGSTLRIHKANIISSNTDAITGLGGLVFDDIGFTGTSSTINVSFVFPDITQFGTLHLANALSTTNGGTNVSSAGSSGNVLTSNGTDWISTTPNTQPTKITKFTGSNTWTKATNPGPVLIRIIAWGGGGGGGSGRVGAVSTARYGGGGGAAGQVIDCLFQASAFSASETVTIGGTANGGNAQTSADSNGNPGTVGNRTSIGSVVVAVGGGFGSGGTNAAGTPGIYPMTVTETGFVYQANEYGYGRSSILSLSPNAGIQGSFLIPSGGGGGGGLLTNNTQGSGSAAGAQYLTDNSTVQTAGGTAGLIDGAGGGMGNNSSINYFWFGATGGGGGAASLITNGGNGGNGGIPGAGGGGGGAALDATGNSGAGGNGARGELWVIEYF